MSISISLSLNSMFLLLIKTTADTSCVEPSDRSVLSPCDMIDYKLHSSLDIKHAVSVATTVIQSEIEFLGQSAYKRKGERQHISNKTLSGDLCTRLLSSTICNILFPPCEGNGTERYRKPCVAFNLSLSYGYVLIL